MCGIAGFYIKRPGMVKNHPKMERFMDLLLMGIESRGKQATGFVASTFDGKTIIDKSDKSASEFIKDRERLPENTQLVLLHTRWATKGSVKEHANNHPVISGTCFVTHNGSIENDDDLFDEHKLDRHAEVDSEVLAAMLSEFGFDEFKKTMEAIEGPAAIAAIDPVKHPGELLLARGRTSPLVVLDSKKFVVWASLQEAIRKAWGEVLGTPPGYKAFEHVPEGTALFLKEGRINREKFEPKKTVYTYAGQASQGFSGRNPVGFGRTGLEDIPWAVGEAVRKLRSDGKGGRARLFSRRYADTDMPAGGSYTWVTCLGCRTQVLNEDMRYSQQYGRVCLDCFEEAINYNVGIRKRLAENRRQGGMFDPSVEIARKAGISMEAVEALTVWSMDEAELNRATLRAVEKETGFDYDFLDFFLFRADYKRIAEDDRFKALYEALEARYNENLAEQADVFPDMFDVEMPEWYELLDHEALKCDVQSKALIELPPVDEDTQADFNVCECGSFMWPTMNTCIACKHRSVVEAKAGIVHEKAEVQKDKLESKCRVCTRKAKNWIVFGNLSPGWCDRHFKECNIRGCKKTPNHVRGDQRICHEHARKTSATADGLMKKRGAIFIPVPKEEVV